MVRSLKIRSACWALFALLPLSAQSESLTLAEVLRASDRFSPVIQAAAARQEATANQAEQAAGAFDLQLSADGFSRASGFYDGIYAGGKVEQPLRNFGANVYGEYRLSSGDFPIYEDVSFTNLGGQLKGGVMLSLLRDREIDSRRFAETDAGLAIDAAELDVLLARIGIQQRAASAYWRWVAAGLQLQVYRDLLGIAEARNDGLQREVASGARAAIFLTENQQTITQRRQFLTNAELSFAMAANALSMFWRDERGLPLTPQASQLPKSLKEKQFGASRTLARLTSSKAIRPDLQLMQNRIQRAAVRLQLDENRLKPRLDMRLEVSEGLGGVGEGGVSRDSTDTIIGFSFSVPLQQRDARSRLAAARSRLRALEFDQQRLDEAIDIELQGLVMSLRFAERLARLAAKDVEQSELLRLAEETRFKNGASDFFLVNVRETAVANARVRQVQAQLATRLAEVAFDAATMDLVRLAVTAAE